MSIYRFVLRTPGGQVEELGFMPLPNVKRPLPLARR